MPNNVPGNLPDNSRDLSEVLAIVRSEMVHLRQSVDKLMHVVIEGNGHSLQSRMLVVENQIHTQSSSYEKSQGSVLAIRMAIMASVLSFASSAILLALTFLLKK